MTVVLTAEAKALVERLVIERNAAQDRLNVAVLAIKAALGVPDGYELRDVNKGFEDVTGVTNGGNN